MTVYDSVLFSIKVVSIQSQGTMSSIGIDALMIKNKSNVAYGVEVDQLRRLKRDGSMKVTRIRGAEEEEYY